MAPPKRTSSGRVTPKGTKNDGVPSAGSPPPRGGRSFGDDHHDVAPSSRYTPPIPMSQRQSPTWVPVLMFALFIVGALIILLYYLGAVPGGRSNWYLIVGLFFVLGGLFTATKYH